MQRMEMAAPKEISQEDEDEISPPLFVRIQTIDLQSLDFQTNIGSTAKFRHLTYIEATNLFLFVGSTSGSVYVFSRDSLKFLFIIPFKGGKVCSIACSQDESDIAVGSIRGKVSIYRISPNVHYMQSSASAPLIDAFRDIYDVPHHVGTEITEMQWSPNGKYLFVGDSQGIVSQMDVACLEEFPRPVPSKIILKLQSRVLQIDCSFPYLAVCTLGAVFLCDLEKEDFTRVQAKKNTDISSTGLCLMILPERSSLRDLEWERTIPSAKLFLFIGEAGSGTIHCCNMEGNVQTSRKVSVSNKVSKYPMPLFDPTKPAFIPVDGEGGIAGDEEEEQVNVSLGKMLCTDDGMIVSVSSNRLYVYDPYTMNVIAWNEDFKRINNFKIISNYAFIWAGNKLEVVAFTPFRSYAEQLFRAKLIDVLESWIVHTVYALGWRRPLSREVDREEPSSCNGGSEEESLSSAVASLESADSAIAISSPSPTVTDKNSDKVISNFRKMMFNESEEGGEFAKFVSGHVPFPLLLKSDSYLDCNSPDSLEGSTSPKPSLEEEEASAMEKPIKLFLSEIDSALQLLSVPVNPPHRPPSMSSSSSISDSHFQSHNDNNRILSALTLMLKRTRGPNDLCLQLFTQMWKALQVFYEEIGCVLPQLDYKKSDLTLSHVLHAAQSFLSQAKLVNLSAEISALVDIAKFEDVAIQMLSCLYCQPSQFKSCSGGDASGAGEAIIPSSSNLFTLCFVKFAQCPLVIQWFRELGTSPETLYYDGIVADTLLLLLPLLPREPEDDSPPTLLSSCLDSIGMYDKLPKYFMTWLFLCRFFHKPKQVPYSPLLRTLLNEQMFEKMAEEMFSTIYRDFRLSSFGGAVHFIHHFVSALILLSKSPGCGHARNVSILLSCFPLTKWAREDIVTKIIAACHLNPALLGLYLKACLEDGNSMKLCACGIQAGYGSLEGRIPSWQRAIEEAIIKLLLEEYFKASPYEEEDDVVQDGNGNSTPKRRRAEMLVHMFAMRRGLLETYFRSPLPDEFLSEELQAELIVRSGSCASLKYFQCNEQNMSLLLKCYQNNFQSRPVQNSKLKVNREQKSRQKESNNNSVAGNQGGYGGKCKHCFAPLQLFNASFKPFSRDCLGLWGLRQTGNVERLIDIVQKCELNVPGVFSARFYSVVVKFSDVSYRGQLNNKYDYDFAGEASNPTCEMFH